MKDSKNRLPEDDAALPSRGNGPRRSDIVEPGQQLINIINFLPDATFVINLAGEVIAWNKAIEDLTGVSAKDMLGKKGYSTFFYSAPRPMLIDLVINPDEAIESLYSNFKRTNGTLQAELFVKVAYGKGMAYLWGQAAALYDDDGNMIGAIESFRDLTHKKKQELALKGSDRWFADIINFLPDAMFAIDKKGKVMAWNRAMEKMTGVRADEMIGKDGQEYSVPFYGQPRPMLIDLVINPDPELLKLFPNLTKDNNIYIAENKANLKNGKREAFLWGQASPVYDEKGEIAGAIESLRDVTEKRMTEEELVRIKKAVESASNAIWLTDENGIDVVYNNRAFERLFGYTGEEINQVGGAPAVFNSLDNARIIHDTLHKGATWSGEVEIRSRDGRVMLVSSFGDQVKDDSGRIIGYLGIVTDVSESKRTNG